MSSYRIALIPGDGIGVDVVTEACKVLIATGLKVETQNYDLGANRYLKSKETLPDSVLEELKKYDLNALVVPSNPSAIDDVYKTFDYVKNLLEKINNDNKKIVLIIMKILILIRVIIIYKTSFGDRFSD